MKRHLSLVLALGLLSGCAATYTKNFPLVEKGMSLAQVNKLIGQPISAESGPGNSKIIYYKLASSPLDTDGSDTREYWVQMTDGVVIGYGERHDAATVMREARQFEAAWNASRQINEALKQPDKVEVNVNVKP